VPKHFLLIGPSPRRSTHLDAPHGRMFEPYVQPRVYRASGRPTRRSARPQTQIPGSLLPRPGSARRLASLSELHGRLASGSWPPTWAALRRSSGADGQGCWCLSNDPPALAPEVPSRRRPDRVHAARRSAWRDLGAVRYGRRNLDMLTLNYWSGFGSVWRMYLEPLLVAPLSCDRRGARIARRLIANARRRAHLSDR
jgi:hypothetical protein